MDTYQSNLVGLLGLSAVLFVAQRTLQDSSPSKKSPGTQSKAQIDKKPTVAAEASQWSFLTVYALAMGSDWLQGPFLYSLYRDEHNVAPSTVSALFTTGFISGAVSGYATGTLADKHGRKRACQFFCIVYALSCILTVAPGSGLPLLFAGRVLGGIGTSLLFSVFESWMVTDFHTRELGKRGANLSRTFGVMSTLNSAVAIASGVSSEWMVDMAGTRKAPFVAAVVLLGVALWVISTTWAENYGAAGTAEKKNGERTLWEMLKDPRIVCLGLASTMFEGSMYLFVFFWGPALASARQRTAAVSKPAVSTLGLPYGIIFATFMASVLAASLVFNLVMQKRLFKYTYLLIGILGAADLVFYTLEQPHSEQLTFWLFCLFEACVGMYWPCMGYLKGQLIDDGSRAQLYGILRVPLNVFVVVSLYFTGDGDAYTQAFSACSRLLLAAIGGLYAMAMNEEQVQ
ncbi:hypothetical protein BD289DRAFT_458671 [Coniella lustricola]|uniref:Molybdate-anion transporter n=1 Tax=Coniella lustricola TaxID=2025994 RepID=A0A2T3AIA0_9PEZI|nr:hypothetical protein BD289DRAFT_458671 [Coniella lustricola]